ncbi:hypothetical protein E3N88_13329 [Mikania micrantha]|uniref:CCHC-type domain-containing protein n=1 Tax=Mikania micrantha TaxID=192012 RepID=A0A5N6P862_9ASTR|nr:hypothetical protein E3N88_13329 [Mikania micrantha]
MFAGNQLKERAKDWWELLRKKKGRDGIKEFTWGAFKELFLKRFCPQAVIDRITKEFLHMRHKEEDIDTITAVFFDKAKLCPDLLRTERMWINRYHSMLNAKYREFLVPSKFETLSKLIDCALVCYKCGKPGHISSQCASALNLCYNCYKPGHRRSECPELRGTSHGGTSGGSFKAQGRGGESSSRKPGKELEIVDNSPKRGPFIRWCYPHSDIIHSTCTVSHPFDLPVTPHSARQTTCSTERMLVRSKGFGSKGGTAYPSWLTLPSVDHAYLQSNHLADLPSFSQSARAHKMGPRDFIQPNPFDCP